MEPAAAQKNLRLGQGFVLEDPARIRIAADGKCLELRGKPLVGLLGNLLAFLGQDAQGPK